MGSNITYGGSVLDLPDKVYSVYLSTSGMAVPGAARVRSFYYRSTTTKGVLRFLDGGANGTLILQLDTAAFSRGQYITIPDPGLIHSTNVYISLSNVDSVMLFYN